MNTRSELAKNTYPSEGVRYSEAAPHTTTIGHYLLSVSLSAAQLLYFWEQGAKLPPYAQALLLLSAVFPTLTQDELADWSLGQRDAALLELHARCYLVPQSRRWQHVHIVLRKQACIFRPLMCAQPMRPLSCQRS